MLDLEEAKELKEPGLGRVGLETKTSGMGDEANVGPGLKLRELP